LLASLGVAGCPERVFGPHGKSCSWQDLHLWPGQVRFGGIHYKWADLVRISTMRCTRVPTLTRFFLHSSHFIMHRRLWLVGGDLPQSFNLTRTMTRDILDSTGGMTGKQSSFNEGSSTVQLKSLRLLPLDAKPIPCDMRTCAVNLRSLAPPRHHPLAVAGHVSGVATYALILN
jgi:hypothetical protein